MDQNEYISAIEIDANAVKIGRVVLDSEALDVLDDIQTDLGDPYMEGLQRVSDILLDNCEELPVEYGEALHLLQMLSNLRRDIKTLVWAVNPLPSGSGYSRRHCTSGDECIAAVETMELAAANDNPDSDSDDSGMQHPGK